MAPHFRTAVITGAGNGIGREFALQLAAAGTAVAVVDIDAEAARRVVAEITVRAGRAEAFVCDVRDEEAMSQLKNDVAAELGDVDLLVNNAAVLAVGPSLDTPLRTMRNAFDVNLWGVVHGCLTFVPGMLERGRGHVLNVASLAGMMSLPQLGIYGATKAAVIAYSETLAAELAGSGVGITILCPSLVNTGFVSRGEGTVAVRSFGERLLKLAGQSPAAVARSGLRAATRNRTALLRTISIPSTSGALALRAKQRSPRGFAGAAAVVARMAATIQ